MTPRKLPCIGIDCRFAHTQSGIGRYTRELVRELITRNDSQNYVLFVQDANDHGLIFPKQPSDNFQLSTFNYPFYSFSEQQHFPSHIKTSGVDLMHFPHFNVPLKCPVPFIVTIHDLILHHYPNQASVLKRMMYKKLMKHAVTKSAHIITVSNFTADDIANYYGDNTRQKMTVTYEGVSDQFKPASADEKNAVRKKYNLPSQFILYVGACKEHKNVQTLIDAVAGDQSLILVTGGKEVNRLKLKPNVRILSVSDDNLPALMSAASLYVQPSLYEGFGLPVLEAMACGTRVVATNRTSLTEICDGHAILVEPTMEGIRDGIAKGIKAPVDEKQRIHAQNFSWEKMAEETTRCYR